MLLEAKADLFKKQELIFLHISPRKNRKSILKNGLTINNKASGYGATPEHKAIYMYHEDNINVIYDMVNVFDDFDVYEIYLDISDKPFLIADEDSKAKDWMSSIETFGTLGISKSIEPQKVKFMMNINRKN